MRRLNWKVAAFVVIALCGVATGWAMVSGSEVEVRRTTVPGVPESSVGSFDWTGNDALVWRSGGGPSARTIAMPYAAMSQFSYSNRLARHLGVAPALVAGIVRKRERKHFFVFTWKDAGGVAQVLEVEVPKDMPRGLLEVLRARAPQACSPAGKECGVDKTPEDGL